jgi:ABC-type glycerol-3-phosphate transport system permease component
MALTVVTLIVFSVIFVAPFVWLVETALKDTSELNAFPIRWLPQQPQWANFARALTMIDYGRYARNSFVLATLYAVLTTMTSALVGFGFARLRGWGKGPLFIVKLSTMMLPPILTIIPTYMIFARLGLIYTYWPWVFWGLSASPFLSFLYRQFFAGIPLELEDAAIIDGCGYGRIFWRIFMPLSKPVTATVAIFSFQWVWGDWFAPLIFLSQDNTTLAVAMSSGYANAQGFILTNVLSAGTIFYTLPVLVLFFLAQRYFVQGIVTTGLKG